MDLQSSQRGPCVTHTKQNTGVFSQVWVGGREDNKFRFRTDFTPEVAKKEPGY